MLRRGSLVFILLFTTLASAQDAAKSTPPLSPYSRLTAAKTAFIRQGSGSEIPYNVITSSMEGWGRFIILNSPEKADLILEVSAPSEGGSSVSISSSTKPSGSSRPEESTPSTREISTGGPVKLVVYDGRSKAALWSGTEQAKSAMRQKAREDNLVQAAEQLFKKFHDRIEPPPTE